MVRAADRLRSDDFAHVRLYLVGTGRSPPRGALDAAPTTSCPAAVSAAFASLTACRFTASASATDCSSSSSAGSYSGSLSAVSRSQACRALVDSRPSDMPLAMACPASRSAFIRWYSACAAWGHVAKVAGSRCVREKPRSVRNKKIFSGTDGGFSACGNGYGAGGGRNRPGPLRKTLESR